MTEPTSGKNDRFQSLLEYQDISDDHERFWGALQTVESCVRIAPWIITREQLSRMAQHTNFSVRSSAASICMDLAHSSPGRVPVDIVIKLSVHDEDWYVEAPANAALKAMAISFPDIVAVFFHRLKSTLVQERAHSARQIENISSKDPHLLDPSQLGKELIRLRRLKDLESVKLLEKALSNVKKSPRREWYRYGL